MCLTINKSKTTKLRKKWAKENRKTVHFYKVLKKSGDILESPYRHSEYNVGWKFADKSCHQKGWIYYGIYSARRVHEGIHAYTTLDKAKRGTAHSENIVKLKFNTEDLIGVGRNQDIVFKKGYLSRKEYNKVLRIS